MSTPNDLMRHALGVQLRWDGRWTKPYRNRFVADDVHTDAWRTLAAAGHARLVSNSEPTDGYPLFVVTDAGRSVALAGITFKRRYGYGRPVNS